ncbi:mRNA turnover protein 4 homolog [Ixodes scapularis]
MLWRMRNCNQQCSFKRTFISQKERRQSLALLCFHDATACGSAEQKLLGIKMAEFKVSMEFLWNSDGTCEVLRESSNPFGTKTRSLRGKKRQKLTGAAAGSEEDEDEEEEEEEEEEDDDDETMTRMKRVAEKKQTTRLGRIWKRMTWNPRRQRRKASRRGPRN